MDVVPIGFGGVTSDGAGTTFDGVLVAPARPSCVVVAVPVVCCGGFCAVVRRIVIVDSLAFSACSFMRRAWLRSGVVEDAMRSISCSALAIPWFAASMLSSASLACPDAMRFDASSSRASVASIRANSASGASADTNSWDRSSSFSFRRYMDEDGITS